MTTANIICYENAPITLTFSRHTFCGRAPKPIAATLNLCLIKQKTSSRQSASALGSKKPYVALTGSQPTCAGNRKRLTRYSKIGDMSRLLKFPKLFYIMWHYRRHQQHLHFESPSPPIITLCKTAAHTHQS